MLDQKVWRRRWNKRGKKETDWSLSGGQMGGTRIYCNPLSDGVRNNQQWATTMGTTGSLVAVMVHPCVSLTGLTERVRWLVNNILGCVCEGVSGRGERLSQETEQRRWPSPVWVGIPQFVEGQSRTQWWRKGGFSLLELGHPSSPALRHRSFWFFGL